MKARLLKKWGGNYAGQVLSNVEPGSIPAGIAEFFEDDDPAVNTVVSQHGSQTPLAVINDAINPDHAKAHNESQRAAAKASRETDGSGLAMAVQKLEDQQTQERARYADEFAANRAQAPEGQLSEEQIKANAAGKGPGTKTGGDADGKK
jgi:hypothetical protein